MSEIEAREGDSNEPLVRPITADIGRRIRWLTGVREDLLDQVPSERSRYNGLAWTMLGTAAMASIGMAILISQISDASTFTVMLAAAGWGTFILGIDYLIVSYTDDEKVMRSLEPILHRDQPTETPAPKSKVARNRTAVRILLAAFLGVTIGESLVLAAFASAATETLDKDRRAELVLELCEINGRLVVYRPELRLPECNPSSETQVASTSTVLPADPVGPGNGTTPTVPPPDLSVYDTADLEAALEEANGKIDFYIEAANCEQNPGPFSPEERSRLGCSGEGGQGPNWATKIGQVATWEATRNQIQEDIRIANQGRIDTQSSYDAANQALADEFREQQISIAEAASSSALEAATKAETDASLEQVRLDNLAGESGAVELVDDQNAAQQRIRDLDDGKSSYGLNERFVATEETVNPWIKWALRLLFVFVDMTPVLLKMTLDPSTVEKMAVMERRGLLYPHLARLKLIEDDFYKDELEAVPRHPAATPPGKTRSRLGSIVDRWFDRPRREGRDRPSQDHSEHSEPDNKREAPDSDPRAGAVVDENTLFIDARGYTKVKKIGSGAFADIYEVKPTSETNGYSYPLVVKLPKKGRKAQFSLSKELEMYRSTRASVGIVTLVGGDRTGIVLRYYPRTSMDRWFFGAESSDNTFTLEDWVQWLRDITVGLRTIWELNHVHGDGKPANLLLTGASRKVPAGAGAGSENSAVIADLGSAVECGSTPATYSFGFSPPEHQGGQRKGPNTSTANPLADIYSFLGATSYYMLSGGVEPWLDQVRPSKADLKSSELPRVRRKWLKTMRESQLTPLRQLNPKVPPAAERQIEQWMSPAPSDRLRMEGQQDHGNWMVSRNRANGELILDRLTLQITKLAQELEHSGADQVSRLVFGDRHPLAFAPEDFPDDTVDYDDAVFVDDSADDL